MATPPSITITNSASGTISSLSYNSVNAGSVSPVQQLLVFNNRNGSQQIADATQVSITTKTFNGLDTGDTVQAGQEVVSYMMLNIQCTSQGDTSYSQVGGSVSAPIGASQTGIIPGSVGGTAAVVNTYLSAPANTSAGSVQYTTRIQYLYT